MGATTLDLDAKLAAEGLKPGQSYVLRRPASDDVTLRVRLLDGRYAPCGGVKASLRTDGGLAFEATSDGQGWVTQKVPKKTAKLRVTYQPKDEDEHTLELELHPPDAKSDAAYLAHLRNLGFGAEGEAETRVVLRFQGTHKELHATGTLDDATKKAIDDVLAGTALKVSGS